VILIFGEGPKENGANADAAERWPKGLVYHRARRYRLSGTQLAAFLSREVTALRGSKFTRRCGLVFITGRRHTAGIAPPAQGTQRAASATRCGVGGGEFGRRRDARDVKTVSQNGTSAAKAVCAWRRDGGVKTPPYKAFYSCGTGDGGDACAMLLESAGNERD
jgi:hypothetical protein